MNKTSMGFRLPETTFVALADVLEVMQYVAAIFLVVLE